MAMTKSCHLQHGYCTGAKGDANVFTGRPE